MLTSEICPDVRFAYPEGSYTYVKVFRDGRITSKVEMIPHTFELTMKVMGIEDYVAYTILPVHMTSEEY